MELNEAKAAIEEMAREVRKDLPTSISHDVDLIDEGHIDSLDRLSLIMKIEDSSSVDKITEFSEGYHDFRISSLAYLLVKYSH